MKLSQLSALLSVSLIALAVSAVWFFARRTKPVPPIVDHPRLAPGVIMRDVTFRSQALQRDMQYRVFMPESAGGKKLVVICLLHGGGGSFRDWSNYSNVAQYAANDFLLVMPQGDYSYYTNAALRPHDRYEDYIVHDLPADVEARFPARSDREGRAIVGVSMGGFGAVKLVLDHPEVFAFAGALSPAIDVPRRAFNWRRLDQSRHFEELFGPEGSEARSNSDPFVLVRSADPSRAAYFYLTCGGQESLLAPNREFVGLLKKYGITHEFYVVPGGHDWNQWNGNLAGLFDALRHHQGLKRATTSALNLAERTAFLAPSYQ